MPHLNPIILSKDLPTAVSFEAKYPGHVDLIIAPEFRQSNDFIVLTAAAAEDLSIQLESAIKQARRMAEQQPLFKEDK